MAQKHTKISPPVNPAARLGLSCLVSPAFVPFLSPVSSPLIIGHRGASVEAPENTLIAFRRALALGVDAIELDVRLTREGVPVVFHDASLRRLTGQAGRVGEKTWRELRAFRVRRTEPIPRLVEVLALIRARAVIQIEIKPGVAVAPVVRAVRRARAAGSVILASFSLAALREARRLAPAIPRMVVSVGRRPAPALARQLAATGAGGLSLDHHAVHSAAFVRFFQARGFSVWCWTVNDRAAIRRLAACGVDAILSDNPALLKRVLA